MYEVVEIIKSVKKIDCILISLIIQVDTKKGETDKKDDSGDSDDNSDIVYDPTSLYKQILEFLQPGETIAKALRRIGEFRF